MGRSGYGVGAEKFLSLVRSFTPFLPPSIFPRSSGDDERPLILAWVDTNEDSIILDC